MVLLFLGGFVVCFVVGFDLLLVVFMIGSFAVITLCYVLLWIWCYVCLRELGLDLCDLCWFFLNALGFPACCLFGVVYCLGFDLACWL